MLAVPMRLSTSTSIDRRILLLPALDKPVLCLYCRSVGTIQDAENVLAGAEVSLRQLMERGLKEHRYADVARIANMADSLASLLQGQHLRRTSVGDGVRSGASPLRSAGRSKKPRSRASARGYPRFERDGDRLVKVGWSKKKKKAYEHRAPREAVTAIGTHLAAHVSAGGVFTIDQLMPVPDSMAGDEVPGYQVYLTVAWLRHVGAVEKKGRDGYILRSKSLAAHDLDQLWTKLPLRST